VFSEQYHLFLPGEDLLTISIPSVVVTCSYTDLPTPLAHDGRCIAPEQSTGKMLVGRNLLGIGDHRLSLFDQIDGQVITPSGVFSGSTGCYHAQAQDNTGGCRRPRNIKTLKAAT